MNLKPALLASALAFSPLTTSYADDHGIEGRKTGYCYEHEDYNLLTNSGQFTTSNRDDGGEPIVRLTMIDTKDFLEFYVDDSGKYCAWNAYMEEETKDIPEEDLPEEGILNLEQERTLVAALCNEALHDYITNNAKAWETAMPILSIFGDTDSLSGYIEASETVGDVMMEVCDGIPDGLK